MERIKLEEPRPPDVEESKIKPDSQSYSEIEFNRGDKQEESPKVLDHRWNTSEDEFVMSLEGVVKLAVEETVSKRDVLSSILKLYDPLGILSPVSTALKTLFQEICKENEDWDSPHLFIKSCYTLPETCLGNRGFTR